MVVQLEVLLFSLALLSAVVSLVVALFAWRNRETASAISLSVLMLAVANWSLGEGFMILTPNNSLKLLFLRWAFVTVVLIPVLWLYFAFEYTGRRLPDTHFLALLVLPLVSIALIWTNELHGYFWSEVEVGVTAMTVSTSYGPWFWVHSIYSYLLLAAGTFLIFQMLFLSDHVYRGQSAALLVAVLAPWLGNAAYLMGFTGGVDVTPFTFTVTGVVLFGALFRYKLLDVVPIAREVARDEIIENLDDPVVVLDRQDRVADVNPAGKDLIGGPVSSIIGHRLDDLLPELAEVVEGGAGEVSLRNGDVTRYYDVRVLPLYRGQGLFAGRVVSLRDITGRRKREQRLDVLNRVLRHDLRNNMNIIHGYAELIHRNPDEAEGRVEDIMERAVELIDMSNEIRKIEDMLDKGGGSKKPVDLVGVVEDTLRGARRDYPDVDYSFDAPDEALVQANELLEPAVQNVVENAVEHNDAENPQVNVKVETTDSYVELEVSDNGPGIPREERDVLLEGEETQLRHTSGIGLWFVNWVVDEFDGEILFDENEPRGSVVSLRFPRAT